MSSNEFHFLSTPLATSGFEYTYKFYNIFNLEIKCVCNIRWWEFVLEFYVALNLILIGELFFDT